MPKVIDYSEELANEICDAISTTNKSVKKLCKLNKHWPSHETIFRWRRLNGHFCDQYTRAKQCQIETLVDDIIEIADDATNDYIENEEGKMVANSEHIGRSRLRIDTRKWLAGKLMPKLYADRNQPKQDGDEDAISKVRVD